MSDFGNLFSAVYLSGSPLKVDNEIKQVYFHITSDINPKTTVKQMGNI